MKALVFFAFTLLSLSACKKEEPLSVLPVSQSCPVKCMTLSYTLIFANNYSPEELDTVIVRKFSDSFSTLILESTYTLADTVHYSDYHHDYVGTGFKDVRLVPGHEYEIEIPATQQVFRVWDIIETDVVMNFDCDMKNKYCYQSPKSISVSGGDYSKDQYYYYPVYLRLKK
ncbi:MAG TPA: hypothetical protein VEB40_14000 [Flavipsychrobacter sp.]|nr:hypothetical protein [Flavipsychrobacter sp.]